MDIYGLIFILLPGLFIRRRNYHYHSVGGGYSFDSWLHLVSENPTGWHQHCSGTRTGGGGWQVLPQQWGQYLHFSEARDAMIHCISNKVVGCLGLNQILMPCTILHVTKLCVSYEQAENGLQSRSSENGMTWHYGLKLQWYLTGDRGWRYGIIWYGLVWGGVTTGMDDWHGWWDFNHGI